ncbi:MAG: hypothetical protein KAT34_05105 [Candidatus Aminicenantes bacterium]|nr:hypothetical protein [Candidatus Aminicenantes bacterium]
MEIFLPEEMFRGGIFLPTINAKSPCYFPQYDTLWCPIKFTENYDNEPNINNNYESKLKYLCSFEHEMGHRHINLRTIIGFIHITFTMLKIHQLFYWFPTLGDKEGTYKKLINIDKTARAFFDYTKILDETFALFHTIDYAKSLGLKEIVEQYKLFTFNHYPFVRKTYERAQFILENLNEEMEMKGLFIRSIFDSAAAVDIWNVLPYGSEENNVIGLNQNVDARFEIILEFCEDTIRNEPNINIKELSSRLLLHLEEKGISIGIQYNPEDFKELFNDITEDYLDGIFSPTIYRVLTTQLLEDMEKLLQRPDKIDFAYPISTVTFRSSDNDDELVPVLRSKLLFERYDLPYSDIKMDVGLAFWDFFKLGTIADIIINEKNKAKTTLKSFKLYGKPDSDFLNTVRRSLRGEIPADSIRKGFSTFIECLFKG